MQPRNVIIYRRDLLPYSETFIREQSEALRGFEPFYAGFKEVGETRLPTEKLRLLSDGSALGRLRLANYRLTQWDPGWIARLRSLRPALIHAHFEWGGKDALPLARALKVPLLVTCHGKDVTERAEDKSGWLGRRFHVRRRLSLQREGTMFLAVSEFIRQQMLARGYPAEQTRVHYIGVDTAKFAPPPDSARREPLIVFVGRLIEKKGCEYLIRAMEVAAPSLPDAELVVIGDGPLWPSLEAMAKEKLRRYRFLGVQSPEQIRDWLGRARLFSVPSVEATSGDSEGFGIVFLEAQSMGVPVVSFRHGGIPEAVAHGVTGLLSDERDWRGLAADLAELFNDEARWQRMSLAARTRTVEEFDLLRQTRALENIYEETLAIAPFPAAERTRVAGASKEFA